MSRAVVRHGLDRAGIDRTGTELARQRERDSLIVRLRDTGLSWVQISVGTGIPTSTLHRRYVRATRPVPDARDTCGQVSANPSVELLQALNPGGASVTGSVEFDPHVGRVPSGSQRHHGGPAPAPKTVVLKLSDVELRQRHAAGQTYKELAQECGATAAHIWRRVNFRI